MPPPPGMPPPAASFFSSGISDTRASVVSSSDAIDEAFCKGCGMCVAECPRRAMEMTLDPAVR